VVVTGLGLAVALPALGIEGAAVVSACSYATVTIVLARRLQVRTGASIAELVPRGEDLRAIAGSLRREPTDSATPFA
jgi:hypothetical protein